MKRRQRKIKLNNKGSAMIIAVALLLILMIFCMMLCMLAYTLFASSLKGSAREQTKMAAVTLSKQLERQITTPKFDGYDSGLAPTSGSAVSVLNTKEQLETLKEGKEPFWFYLRYNIWQSSWPYYNEDERGHLKKNAFRYFKLTEGDSEIISNYGLDDVSICMYWCSDYDTKDKDGTPFYIRVTCKRDNQSYSVLSHYSLGVSSYVQGGSHAADKENGDAAGENIKKIVNPSDNQILKNEKWIWSLDARE